MFRLSLYPIFDSYALVAVVALVLMGLMWFGPSRQRLGPWQRAMLAMLRTMVIMLLLLAMLRPTLIYTQTKKQAATLVVLADQSRSMTVPDAIGNKTRWTALSNAVEEASPAFARLQQDFELKAYTFDSELHDAIVENGKIALPEKPEGTQTAIGSSIEDMLGREAGKRLLGVVLLSDGAQRAYAPRDIPPQTAAARLKHLGYPIFTFPLGQSRGLGEAKDVSVKDLVANPTVFVKNELTVSGQVRVDGFVNLEIPVRLLFETSPGKMEAVAQQKIKATTDGQQIPVTFRYVPQVPGEFRVTIEAGEQKGELVTTNNGLSTFVNVLKGGLNVLYLEGALRVEQKFIRRALDSSPDTKVDYLRIDPRDAKTLPTNLAESFQPGKYDVYILGDIDATAFPNGELAALAKCVQRGAGLVMLGGFQSFGAGGYADTPLANVLPIVMNRFERQTLNETLRTDLHWPGPLSMRPTALGQMHFALMLAGNPQESAAVWAKLPPLEGANKFRGLAPGVVILASAGNDKPLLVAHNYGDGRVMAFAGDSTWRWWMNGYDAAFKRFWRQVVLWLARKDQLQESNVWIRLTQRRFAPMQRVDFVVGANAPSGEPIADATFKAELVLPDGTRRPVALVRQEEQMAGSLRDLQAAGDYSLEVTATQKGQSLGGSRARFLVFQQDLELDNASADISTMEGLAAMTGGRSLAPEELPALIKKLAEDTQSLDIQQETKKTFWDTWTFFLTLVALLSVEWFLRKRWGLV
jgi:uncharacterized membrane protein